MSHVHKLALASSIEGNNLDGTNWWITAQLQKRESPTKSIKDWITASYSHTACCHFRGQLKIRQHTFNCLFWIHIEIIWNHFTTTSTQIPRHLWSNSPWYLCYRYELRTVQLPSVTLLDWLRRRDPSGRRRLRHRPPSTAFPISLPWHPWGQWSPGEGQWWCHQGGQWHCSQRQSPGSFCRLHIQSPRQRSKQVTASSESLSVSPHMPMVVCSCDTCDTSM